MAAVPPEVYVSFSAEIVPHTTESLLAVCANIANSGVPKVHLLLSTPGGSVMHGLNLYNILRGMPFHLTTHNTGSVNSIGNMVFLAGEERFACATATFMFHGVGLQLPQLTRLEEKGLQEHLASVQADQQRIASVMAARTNLSEGDIRALFLQAVTKDAVYAKSCGIIHDICEVSIPPGAPVQQLIFQR